MLGDEFPFDADSACQQEKKRKRKEALEPKISSKELNPFYRAQISASPIPQTSPKPADDQVSIEWTCVLIKRAVQQIHSGEATLEKVAVDRFGSIESFRTAVEAVEKHKGIRYNLRYDQVPVKGAKSPEPVVSAHIIQSEQAQDVDINKLVAKKLKAELGGDFEVARKLEDEIAAAQSAKRPNKITLLPKEAYAASKKYDTNTSIAEMVRHEKLSTRNDIETDFIRNYREEDDEHISSYHVGKTFQPSKDASMDAVVKKYRQQEQVQTECRYCQAIRQNSWQVASRGAYTCLMIPFTQSLSSLHCIIVPLQHCGSFLDMNEFEEEVWEEVRNYKKCLLRMASTLERSFVFTECTLNPESIRRHAFIDCIPTARGMPSNDDARGYFKQVLLQVDEEWSQHKKIIETDRGAGLRSKLPRNRNFPYFYVDFRLDEGFAHVIEDAEKFGTEEFGRNLMASSILKLSRHEWRHRQSTNADREAFLKYWVPFDWTKDL